MADTGIQERNALAGQRLLGGFVQIGEFLGLLPYGWDWSSNEMYYKPGWRFKILHAIWFTGLCSYGGFLMKNWAMLMQDDEVTAFTKIRVAYWTFVYLWLDFGFWLNMQSLGQHHVVVNQLMNFTTKARREIDFEINGRVLNTVLGITTFAYFFGCTNVLAVFTAPKSQRLLTSLWENPQDLPIWMKLIILLAHLMLSLGQAYHLVHHLHMLMTYVFMVLPAVSRLRWHGMQNRISSELPGSSQGTPLSPLDIKRLFEQILVLQANYTCAYSGWLLVIMVCLLYMAVMNVFQAAVFHDFRALVMATCVITLVKNVFKTSGAVYEISKQVIASWGSIQNPEWFPRYRLAARPARVSIGPVFYFDKGIMPTFMDIVISTAASMILSYNQ